jgi:hypothetical protein
MKKNVRRAQITRLKLALNTETIRVLRPLSRTELRTNIVGATGEICKQCSITKTTNSVADTGTETETETDP